MKVYDVPWNKVQPKDRPAAGEVYLCRATELGEMQAIGVSGYVVAVMGDGTPEGDTVRRGMFWTKADALVFANALHVPAPRHHIKEADTGPLMATPRHPSHFPALPCQRHTR
jgi:hypothetical protein